MSEKPPELPPKEPPLPEEDRQKRLREIEEELKGIDRDLNRLRRRAVTLERGGNPAPPKPGEPTLTNLIKRQQRLRDERMRLFQK